MRRPKHTCVSCKRLKIGCDRALPCEYCRATGRDCVYESTRTASSTPSSEQVSTGQASPDSSDATGSLKSLESPKTLLEGLEGLDGIAVATSAATKRLNADVGVSPLECRLLREFSIHYLGNENLHRYARKKDPMYRVWAREIPLLWQESLLIRRNVYAVSAMHLCNKAADKGAAKRVGRSLYVHTLEYFEGSVQALGGIIQKVVDKEIVPLTTCAAEITILLLFLYIFFSSQRFLLLLLISYSPDVPDFVKLMRLFLRAYPKVLPLLTGTNYNGTDLLARALTLSTMSPRPLPSPLPQPLPQTALSRYPVAAMLEKEWRELLPAYTDPRSVEAIGTTVAVLLGCVARAVSNKVARLLCAWIFVMDAHVFSLMEQGDPFALRILFVYACLAILSEPGYNCRRNIYRQFIDETTRALSPLEQSLCTLVENGVCLKGREWVLERPLSEWQ